MNRHLFPAIVLSAGLAAPAVAHAYIDPGTGSVLIQGLIAAVTAVFVAGRHYLYRFLGLIGLRKKPSKQEDVDAGGQAQTDVAEKVDQITE